MLCTSAQKQELENVGLVLFITEGNGIFLETVRAVNCNESTCTARNSPLDAGNKNTPLPGENKHLYVERFYIFFGISHLFIWRAQFYLNQNACNLNVCFKIRSFIGLLILNNTKWHQTLEVICPAAVTKHCYWRWMIKLIEFFCFLGKQLKEMCLFPYSCPGAFWLILTSSSPVPVDQKKNNIFWWLMQCWQQQAVWIQHRKIFLVDFSESRTEASTWQESSLTR